MKQKYRRGEALTGYLMVLPAALIIGMISIFPILRTFFFSAFDYRLNDPGKNSVLLETRLNLESFLDGSFYLESALIKLGKSAPPEEAAALTEIGDRFHRMEDAVRQLAGDRYEKAKALVDAMQPVEDETLRYLPLSPAEAASLREEGEAVRGALSSLRRTPEDAYSQAAELAGELSSAVVMPNFVGLDNYARLFRELTVKNGELGRLGRSLLNTLGFTLITVFLELVFGLAVAGLCNRAFRGRGLIRACMLIPWAVPTAVSAMMWKFLCDGQTGIIAHLLAAAGLLDDSGALMGISAGSCFAIILADVWKTTPYMALLILAGMQLISGQLYESAQIDGAGKIQQFFSITLPMLRPTLMVALLFRSLDAFRVFDLIFVMTGGGPGYATESISIYAYKTMFSQMDFGKGSALAVILFLCVAVMSCFYIKLLGSNLTGEER